jgi:hypothetical protein
MNMSIEAYIRVQRSNLKSIIRLPEFELVRLVDGLYKRGTELVRSDLPPRYGQFLLLAHQSLLSGATLSHRPNRSMLVLSPEELSKLPEFALLQSMTKRPTKNGWHLRKEKHDGKRDNGEKNPRVCTWPLSCTTSN